MAPSAPSVRRRPLRGRLISATLAMAAGMVWAVALAAPNDPNARLESMMAAMQAQHAASQRVRTADDLELFVSHLDQAGLKSINVPTIDDIADLLNSPLDGVKTAAARALGRIGSRAKSVLPLLRLTRDQLKAGGEGGKGGKAPSRAFTAVQAAIASIGKT